MDFSHIIIKKENDDELEKKTEESNTLTGSTSDLFCSDIKIEEELNLPDFTFPLMHIKEEIDNEIVNIKTESNNSDDEAWFYERTDEYFKSNKFNPSSSNVEVYTNFDETSSEEYQNTTEYIKIENPQSELDVDDNDSLLTVIETMDDDENREIKAHNSLEDFIDDDIILSSDSECNTKTKSLQKKPVSACFLTTCKNLDEEHNVENNANLFKLIKPFNEDIQVLWEKNLRINYNNFRQKFIVPAFVCDKHFEKKYIKFNGKLNKFAIPTLLLPKNNDLSNYNKNYLKEFTDNKIYNEYGNEILSVQLLEKESGIVSDSNKSCFISNCRKQYSNNLHDLYELTKSIHFYKVWMVYLNIKSESELDGKKVYVCERHFDSTFRKGNGKLKKYSVPTLGLDVKFEFLKTYVFPNSTKLNQDDPIVNSEKINNSKFDEDFVEERFDAEKFNHWMNDDCKKQSTQIIENSNSCDQCDIYRNDIIKLTSQLYQARREIHALNQYSTKLRNVYIKKQKVCADMLCKLNKESDMKKQKI